MSNLLSADYIARIKNIHKELGIPEDYASRFKLWMQEEARESDLIFAGKDLFSRDQFLLPEVEKRWRVMRKAAQRDFVELSLVSCFRSVDYQKSLIEKKLQAGQDINSILKVSAAPGHSEHHTGRAIDVGASGSEPLTEAFDQTPSFEWLMEQGEKYGFHLSYPKNNASGITYEPWHWAFGHF